VILEWASPRVARSTARCTYFRRSGLSSSTKDEPTQEIPSPRKNGYSGNCSSRSCLKEMLESLLLVRLRVACEFGKTATLVGDAIGRKRQKATVLIVSPDSFGPASGPGHNSWILAIGDPWPR